MLKGKFVQKLEKDIKLWCKPILGPISDKFKSQILKIICDNEGT